MLTVGNGAKLIPKAFVLYTSILMVHDILFDAYEDPDGADVLPASAVVVEVDTSISS